MSNEVYKNNEYDVIYGYDAILDYVFMVILKDDEIVYSNIDDKEIDFMIQKDFNYFVKLAFEKFGICIPKEIITKVEDEVKNRAKNDDFNSSSV